MKVTSQFAVYFCACSLDWGDLGSLAKITKSCRPKTYEDLAENLGESLAGETAEISPRSRRDSSPNIKLSEAKKKC